MPRIERGERLVGDQRRRAGRKRAREHDARALAARQIGRGAIGEMRGAGIAQSGVDGGLIERTDPRERPEMRQPPEPDQPPNAEWPVQRIGLRQIGDVARDRGAAERRHVGAVDRHAPCRGRKQSEQRACQRRFARAVWADHADQRAVLERHVKAIEHAASAKIDRQRLGRDRHHKRRSRSK